MKSRMKLTLAVVLTSLPVLAFAQVNNAPPLPGDRGRMGKLESLAAPPAAAAPAAARPSGAPTPKVPGPSMKMALKAAQAMAAACKQYTFGMAVVDSAGGVKLIYIPDGSDAWHGYHSVRKAYTAITFGMDTSKMIQKVRAEPALIEKFRADPNLETGPGGIVLTSGGKVIGAIGISGALQGGVGHDEECGNVGREAIKNLLK